MKVYIITECVMHEGESIEGVYPSEERANEALKDWQKRLPITEGAYRKSVWYNLQEYEVEESK